MDSVVVTGAGGFVGRHVVPALLAGGFAVHAVCRAGAVPPGATRHEADLMDPQQVAALMDRVRPSHLLHLAWAVAPGQFWHAPENLDWVVSSLVLYRAFVRAGGRRMLGVGTCAEYDWSFGLLDEAETPLRPATLYGASKDALRRILEAAGPRDGVAVAWARLFFLYGPGEPAARLVPDVALSLLAGRPALCGDGAAMRDFLYVADAAAALAAVLVSDHAGPVNIASGDCVPIRSVVSGLAEIIGRPELVRLGARPPVPGEPERLAAGMSVLRDRLGFRPSFTLKEGLAATAAWWRDRTTAG